MLTAFAGLIFALFMRVGTVNYLTPFDRLENFWLPYESLELIRADYEQNLQGQDLFNFRDRIVAKDLAYNIPQSWSVNAQFVDSELNVVNIDETNENYVFYGLVVTIIDSSSGQKATQLFSVYF